MFLDYHNNPYISINLNPIMSNEPVTIQQEPDIRGLPGCYETFYLKRRSFMEKRRSIEQADGKIVLTQTQEYPDGSYNFGQISLDKDNNTIYYLTRPFGEDETTKIQFSVEGLEILLVEKPIKR